MRVYLSCFSFVNHFMNTITLPYNSNDAHIWTYRDPDLELIEPRILVSINRNYLVFGRKVSRPSLNHQVTLVNHGEHSVAFKVMTTDNYAYFVNQVFGIIPGRHLHALPHVRAPNQFTLQVYRRPYNCFCDEQQPSHWNTPRKDKLFILLAPVFSFSIPPASLFHHEGAYEKLRVCLEYTGMPSDPAKDVSLIFKRFRGWCTWEVERRKEGSWELLGKTKDEAKSMIINEPCSIPLAFEEIPEPVQDLSKKRRETKREKRKSKATEVLNKESATPNMPTPVTTPTPATSDSREKFGMGSSRDEKPIASITEYLRAAKADKIARVDGEEQLSHMSTVGDVVMTTTKLNYTNSKEILAGGRFQIPVPKQGNFERSATTQDSKQDIPAPSQYSKQNISAPTQNSGQDTLAKPLSKRVQKSAIQSLKDLISVKTQVFTSKISTPMPIENQRTQKSFPADLVPKEEEKTSLLAITKESQATDPNNVAL